MNEAFCERPWGKWLVLALQPGYKVKKLTLEPGKSMSKQYHTHRDEYWVIIQGKGQLLLDLRNVCLDPEEKNYEVDIPLKQGTFAKIDKQVIHKVTNTGDEPLIIIETQVGEITEEGDIVRLD